MSAKTLSALFIFSTENSVHLSNSSRNTLCVPDSGQRASLVPAIASELLEKGILLPAIHLHCLEPVLN